MKIIASLFILIIAIIHNNHCFSKIKQIDESNQCLTVNAIEKKIKEKSVLNIKISNFSNIIQAKHKKRNRKGVRPVFFHLTNESFYIINTIEDRSVELSQIFYCPHLFPGNGKRGPPFFASSIIS